MIYLKIIEDGTVEAYGDELTLENSGGTYDMSLSEEEWEEAWCTARVNDDGEIYLGLTEDEIYDLYAEQIIGERDKRLETCDSMSPIKWATLSEEEQQAWIDYRNALLDIENQEGFPWDGINAPWPTDPDGNSGMYKPDYKPDGEDGDDSPDN